MPILTKQIYTINQINKMDISGNEKIVLLKEISIDEKSAGCSSCAARIRNAKRLLDQMINYEIRKIIESGQSSNGQDN